MSMNFNCCRLNKSNNYLRQTVDFLKIISEENRLKILCILQRQEMCVCKIWQYLGLSQNLTSHHLKILRDFTLIESRKEGLKIFYSINKKSIKSYSKLLTKFLSE